MVVVGRPRMVLLIAHFIFLLFGSCRGSIFGYRHGGATAATIFGFGGNGSKRNKTYNRGNGHNNDSRNYYGTAINKQFPPLVSPSASSSGGHLDMQHQQEQNQWQQEQQPNVPPPPRRPPPPPPPPVPRQNSKHTIESIAKQRFGQDQDENLQEDKDQDLQQVDNNSAVFEEEKTDDIVLHPEESGLSRPSPPGVESWPPPRPLNALDDAGVSPWFPPSQSTTVPHPNLQQTTSSSSFNGIDPCYPSPMEPQQHHQLYMVRRDLESALHREQALLTQIHNATNALLGMEHREELHIRQLDVLTERFVDVEAKAAQQHNQLLEYQANFTTLDLEMARLREQVSEWKTRCLTAQDELNTQMAENAKLLQKLDKATLEAETLATRVERHRLDQAREQYQKRLDEKKSLASASTGRRRTRRSSDSGWWGFLSGSWALEGVGAAVASSGGQDDQELVALQEAAKATLLHVLQTERNNVDELEGKVTVLQQNNSAMALQVRSRDEIIDELNERVAVFEQDKIVLKAALKQLQKEMAQETPKLQELGRALQAAQAIIQQQQDDIASMTQAHESEIQNLQHLLDLKELAIHQAQSNLTVIGEYVDKLEERLTDFALARRDIDQRERACAALEHNAEQLQVECAALREQLKHADEKYKHLETQHEQTVEHRDALNEQLKLLSTEKTRAIDQVQALQKIVESLRLERRPSPPMAVSSQVDSMSRLRDSEHQLASLSQETTQLKHSIAQSDHAVSHLRQQVQTREELSQQ